MQTQVAAGKQGDQVQRAVHKVRRLRWKIGKAVNRQVKGKVPDTYFLIDRSSLPGPYGR